MHSYVDSGSFIFKCDSKINSDPPSNTEIGNVLKGT